jgi:hypothetical protein
MNEKELVEALVERMAIKEMADSNSLKPASDNTVAQKEAFRQWLWENQSDDCKEYFKNKVKNTLRSEKDLCLKIENFCPACHGEGKTQSNIYTFSLSCSVCEKTGKITEYIRISDYLESEK